MGTDELFMQRALELASLGRGQASPNPLVGCVIAHSGKIIGEGYHARYGHHHAEVEAINSVKKPELLPQSTVYVNLEPCAHFGKTPPCADLLVKHRVKNVVICNTDPNPLVAGKGIARLQAAGISVKTKLLEKQGIWLNRRFFTFLQRKRPYIILKWAETADGFMARTSMDSKWISNAMSRRLVHAWRTQEDAIMVGAATAHYDNPLLNVRDWQGRDPVRVISDPELSLNRQLQIFNGKQSTICYNAREGSTSHHTTFVKLQTGYGYKEVFEDLYKRKIQSIIVEGGPKTLNMLVNQGLWDEARIFKSPVCFLEGIAAPAHPGKLQSVNRVADNHFFIYTRHQPED